DERDAIGHAGGGFQLRDEPTAAESAVSAAHGAVGVGQQREVELELLGELAMRRLVLRRDTKDRRALGGDVLVVVAQRARLLVAAGRVVHRVEVHHQLLAAEVLERDGLAFGGLRGEVGGGVARRESIGQERSYQWIPCVICANATCSGVSSTSLASSPFLPFAAPESGNMRKAVLSRIRVAFGATACRISPKTPRRVAIRTGL